MGQGFPESSWKGDREKKVERRNEQAPSSSVLGLECGLRAAGRAATCDGEGTGSAKATGWGRDAESLRERGSRGSVGLPSGPGRLAAGLFIIIITIYVYFY